MLKGEDKETNKIVGQRLVKKRKAEYSPKRLPYWRSRVKRIVMYMYKLKKWLEKLESG